MIIEKFLTLESVYAQIRRLCWVTIKKTADQTGNECRWQYRGWLSRLRVAKACVTGILHHSVNLAALRRAAAF